MYRYEEPSLFSGRRGAAFIAVIALHVLIAWAFMSGLAGKLVQKIVPPVEIAQIDKPKDVDKPPPPPPKLEEVKPFVPPPEFVDIQAPQQETTAITQTTQVAQPPAPVAQAPAPVQHSISPPIYDGKGHPFKIGEDYYPDASKRANEEGSCVLLMRVSTTGQILDATVQTSSGFPRLDEACLKGVKGQRMGKPAMEDGKPIEGTFPFKITWKLTGR
jgi:periplasmic protein TonB